MVRDARLGTELAGYRIERLIGRGGASVVYLAEHVRLGRLVALKLLAPHLADDAAFRERFIRESRIAAGLDHPSIVTVYDAGEVDGILYLAMRYVDGTDLARLISEQDTIDPWRSVLLLRQVASALDAAHLEGLVHRDVKPGNILLEHGDVGTERAFLSDFGVTKRITSRTALTRTGQFVGTLDYVAPEQITGQPADGRADVYSLGCVLYQCLSGHVPFPRDTDVATIYGHLQDPPPSLADGPAPLAGLDGVITRALAKHPEDRYPTCGGLVEAARNAIGEPTVVVDRAVLRPELPRAARGPSPVDAEPGVATTEIIPRPEVRRSRRIWPISVTAASIAGLIVAWTLLSNADRRDQPSASEAASASDVFAGTTPKTWSNFVWKRESTQPGLVGPGEQALLDATATPSGVIAVGHVAHRPDPSDAGIWLSTDGQEWRSTDAPGLRMEGEQRATTVAEKAGVIVAMGWTYDASGLDAIAWRSTDGGRSWTSLQSPSWKLPGRQVVRDVVTSRGSFVAVGYDESTGDRQGAAWRSVDGRRWKPMVDADLGGTGYQELDGAVSASGAVVASGYTAERGDQDAAFWILRDGDWRRVNEDILAATGDQQALSIAQGNGPTFVAAGFDDATGSVDAAVWRSTDGETWERVHMDPRVAGGDGDQQMVSVTEFRGGFVAGGHAMSELGDLDAAAWISTDGRDWARGDPSSLALDGLGGPEDQEIRALIDLVGSEVQLVAVGVDHAEAAEDAAVWGGYAYASVG